MRQNRAHHHPKPAKAIPGAMQRSGMEPGIQRMNREASNYSVPLTRLVMC
jgi:hypothetical protein